MFADAGVGSATLLHIAAADGRGDFARIAQALRMGRLLAGASALLVALGLAATMWMLHLKPAWIGTSLGDDAPMLVMLMGIDVVITLLSSPGYALFFGKQQTSIVAIYQGLGIVGGMICGLLGVWATRSPRSILVAAAVCNAICGALCLLHGRIRFPWAFQGGSWLDLSQLRAILRSAVKSFGAQIGTVLSGSAPILAISWGAGAKAVPLYTIPLTLLSLSISALQSFNAVLQPSFGEAFAREDHAWIAGTIKSILRQSMALLCWLAGGYLFLAQPFVALWTANRIVPSRWMLIGLVVATLPQLPLSVLRFALTGINRHRQVATSSILEGLLGLGLATVAVRHLGPDMVGYAAAIALCATSAWVVPRAAKAHFPGLDLGLPPTFLARIVAVLLGTLAVGSLSSFLLHGATLIVVGGFLITAAYAGLLYFLLPGEFHQLRSLMQPLLRRLLRHRSLQ
jgi:O-antigen/teichoic acid export membrane protein